MRATSHGHNRVRGRTSGNNVLDALEREITFPKGHKPDFARVASLFMDEEPSWTYTCCNQQHRVRKRSVVEMAFKFLLFSCLIGYVTFQLIKYFDESHNRKSHVQIERVDIVPLPFIYIDFPTVDGSYDDCWDYKFYIEHNTTSGPIVRTQFDEWTDYDINMKLTDVFKLINSGNGSKYIVNDLWVQGNWKQLLFFPSAEDDLVAIGQHHMVFHALVKDNADCYSGGINEYLYAVAGYTDELDYEFETIYDALHKFFYSESELVLTGYEISHYFQWYSFENHVDPHEKHMHDYYSVQVGSIFATSSNLSIYNSINNNKNSDSNSSNYYSILSNTNDDDENNNSSSNQTSEDVGLYIQTVLKYMPREPVILTKFITKPSTDLLDVVGLAGGMYSTAEGLCQYLTLIAVWGFAIGKCKFGGFSRTSGPQGILKIQLESFLQARDETIIELTQQLVATTAKVDKCEKKIKELEQIFEMTTQPTSRNPNRSSLQLLLAPIKPRRTQQLYDRTTGRVSVSSKKNKNFHSNFNLNTNRGDENTKTNDNNDNEDNDHNNENDNENVNELELESIDGSADIQILLDTLAEHDDGDDAKSAELSHQD